MDEEQVQEAEQVISEVTETEAPTVETLVAAEVSKLELQYKKELAGLNRRNSEMETILEDQKKAAMEDQERVMYELEKEKAALTNAQADFSRSQNKEKALKFAAENKIPVSLLDTMSFDNLEAVESNLNIIKAVVDGEREKAITEFKTNSGHAPAAGSSGSQGMYGPEAIAKMSPSEMTQALKEGRIPGFGKL